ncbi:diguanylate cyclase [Desulfovibrio mangrovi]|uniref:diguanylate cyclase domain-containing protein n=1 Tax=Desulfovibrio mangrovi TaxID=2976983 RepID=UPI002246D320|nr:diguanylate cyclase [Desulfovibrio mangrovi]UZP67570.1 diguanylate cyclase [Desulfovibrio mangrovi]
MIARRTLKELKLYAIPPVAHDAQVSTIADILIEQKTSSIPIALSNGSFVAVSAKTLLNHAPDDSLSFEHADMNDIVMADASDTILAHLTCTNIQRDTLIVVTENGSPIGYTQITSIIAQLFSSELCYTEHLLSSEKHEIVHRDESIYTAHKKLFNTHSRIAIVVDDNGHTEGIVTDRLISSLIEQGCDIWHTKTSEVALDTQVLPRKDCLHLFLSSFLLKPIDIAVVTNAEGSPIGTLSREDILTGYCECPIRQSASLTDATVPAPEVSKGRAAFLEKVLAHTFKTGIIGTDEHLGIIYFNSAAGEFLDKPEQLRLGNPIWIISDACNISRHELLEALKNARAGNEQVINSWLNIDGEKRYVQYRINIVPSSEGLAGYVLTIQDTTSQKHAEANIRKLAYYDKLTQLPNRLLFEERIQQEIKRCKRTQSRFTFMIMDLNGFKEVNDTFGHHVGDMLLSQVGNRLERAIRASDTVARYGGDEFIFLLPEVGSPESAQTFTDKIQRMTNQPYMIDEHEIQITASLGFAIFPDDGESYEELLKFADAMMYRNKRAC